MTKATTWILGVALAGLVAVAGAGCKKQAGVSKTPTYNSVQVDMPKLAAALATAGQDVLSDLNHVKYGLRYKRYPEALEALDKIKDNPKLTDEQKKVVSEVSEQIKQVAEKAVEAKPAQ